jgi:hypothetical protein
MVIGSLVSDVTKASSVRDQAGVKAARRVGVGMLVARNSRENDTTDVLTAPATDQDRQAGALVVERPGNLTPGDALPTPCGGGRPSRS